MWHEAVEADGVSNGSNTPPLPLRVPAPPPPAFVRSHSLGKTENKLAYQGHDEPLPLNLLGRHTHHYPVPSKGHENAEFSKVRMVFLLI